MAFDFTPELQNLAERAMCDIAPRFSEIDAVAEANTKRVLEAFQRHRVSESCFAGTTGYGFDDRGRETLEKIYADVFGTESALVRTGFVNGTHAITAALFGALRPGDTLLSVTGRPYDTICPAIGLGKDTRGSLREWGVGYGQVDIPENKSEYHEAVSRASGDKAVKAVLIQRSRGYSSRPALSVGDMAELCAVIRSVNRGAANIVDNCYGEFTEELEPTACGADIAAGSLIKNPGGGLAPTGGYIAGRADLVEGASYRMTSPGIGGECGATLSVNRTLFQGLFVAPHVTAQALKTAVFCARMFELGGFGTAPRWDERRSDIIQTVTLGTPELVRRFCRGIQAASPVDSYVTPEPWAMPGYDCDVIMAAGAFIQGSSIELSADAPMREPYTVYLQGGITFEAGKLGIMSAIYDMSRK
ncbi:MAG: hypothetical protein GX823_05130 [Clostridiales bacterium]|nr:hypothetical protein [Clostridiales bacterium]